MRIGILGGTFDPVHNGHLALATAAISNCGLDDIIFVPVAVPPHKPNQRVEGFEHRCKMIDIAISELDYIRCSRLEESLPTPSYTVDSLRKINSFAKNKDNEYFFIIGSDAFLEIETWKSFKEVVSSTNFIIASRTGHDIKKAYQLKEKYSELFKKVYFLTDDIVDISSTKVKSLLKEKKSLNKYIPRKVEEYIKTNNLYNGRLWEEEVPLMLEGYHEKILNDAYGKASHGEKVFPLRENVFNSMRLTRFDDLRVVIIGQDPYFNEHNQGPEAHGLCFSVKDGIPTPPSLRNIFKEIAQTVYKGKEYKSSTDLERWAKQGVLLLNASLTVIKKKPNSHANLGWHKLTDDIIKTISGKKEHIVFMLWGAFAQKKEQLIDKNKHLILKTTHPSPLSAHRGFLGSNVFIKCNNYLKKNNLEPIKW